MERRIGGYNGASSFLSSFGKATVTNSNVSQPAVELILATEPAQIEEVRTLFLEYQQSLGFSLCFQNFDDELKGLPGAYAPPAGRLFLASVGGETAGCIGLRRLEPVICEMKRLYVRPQYRGLRLGRTLVERVIAEARAIGYERMRLDTDQASMQDAVALYRRMGFREIPAYTNIPMKDALWLELVL